MMETMMMMTMMIPTIMCTVRIVAALGYNVDRCVLLVNLPLTHTGSTIMPAIVVVM